MADPTMNEISEGLKEIRTEIEKKDIADTGKIENITELLDTQEELNQKNALAFAKSENDRKDAEERLETLEKAMSRVGNGAGEQDQKNEETKALQKFICKGLDSLTPEEVKYLRTDNELDGGVLAPTEMVNEIIKGITETSAIRNIARVRTMSAGRMELVVRNGLVAAEWEGEGETGTDDNTQYGKEKIPLNKLTVTVPITIEELMDASFNMESEINSDIIESFGQKEGTAFVQGDAVKKPEGFAVESALQTAARTTGLAANITMDSILKLAGDLKTGYAPVYLMNRTTIADIRILKDGVGQYLWQIGNIAAGIPNQINGFTYIETPDMDDIAANTFPIAFGDFRKGYLIGDGLRMDIIRDPFSLKKSGKVEFTFTRRVGGGVVNAEAIKLLKVAV